ncbi:MAG: NADH oxidase [Gammaproteobacteria bacterium]|nr:MAG: NADH oxidase [Gammaproteobacteria bacterium]
MQKVIVIGSNHAGTHSILTLADNYSDQCQVTTYDRNTNISFLGCGMALWISKMIAGASGLFYATPELLESKGVSVNMGHEVTSINVDNKQVIVKNIETEEVITDSYDKLIIAAGSWPILPPIPGMELENVHYAKIYQNAQEVNEKMNDPAIKKVAVVGAGYIGVELAEAFKRNGKEIVLINDMNVLNCYYDPEFQEMMRQNLADNGIELAIGERVTEIQGKDGKVCGVVTDTKQFDVDMVLMSVGFRPNTDFLKGTGIELDQRGVIKVNNRQETNIPDVYAIGDCCDIQNNASETREYIALATNAVRTGIVAAHNCAGGNMEMLGVQGSNAIHIFDLSLCSTGMTEEVAKQKGFDVKTVTVTENIRPDFMPDNEEVTLKVVWDSKTGRILGAQMGSREDITLALHMFSLMIQEKYPIQKLALLDQFFLPHFNRPANFITKAGLMALSM